MSSSSRKTHPLDPPRGYYRCHTKEKRGLGWSHRSQLRSQGPRVRLRKAAKGSNGRMPPVFAPQWGQTSQVRRGRHAFVLNFTQ
ncbi:hypothetical protein V6N13_020651 [Hibiscus sabdariffa]|uniref:Uncharacterized protein n=1 Tax=Hibiscus sabdariffa TaxID=183260 RepID=A0ABR2EU41_9ROSI